MKREEFPVVLYKNIYSLPGWKCPKRKVMMTEFFSDESEGQSRAERVRYAQERRGKRRNGS
jgi:hypothetical protein